MSLMLFLCLVTYVAVGAAILQRGKLIDEDRATPSLHLVQSRAWRATSASDGRDAPVSTNAWPDNQTSVASLDAYGNFRIEDPTAPRESQIEASKATKIAKAAQTNLDMARAAVDSNDEVKGGYVGSRLWRENVQLRVDFARLTTEVEQLRKQNAEIRKDDAKIRTDDARFRRAALARDGPSAVAAGVFRMSAHLLGDGEDARTARATKGLTIFVVVSAVAVLAVLFLCDCMRSEDDSDDELDADSPYSQGDAEERLRRLISKPGQEKGRSCCGCFSFCCNKQIAIFFFCVTVITILGGAVLGQMGLLQPIISQFTVYTYVAVVIVLFVGLLISELWRALRTLVRYIIIEFRKMKMFFQGGFGFGKVEHAVKDLFDDGRVNRSAVPEQDFSRARRHARRPGTHR